MGASVVGEDAVDGRRFVLFESGGIKRRRERRNGHGLVLIEYLGTVRAAALLELFGRIIQNPLTTATPNTGPVRRKKLGVDTPATTRLIGIIDFKELFSHPTSVRSTGPESVDPRSMIHREGQP